MKNEDEPVLAAKKTRRREKPRIVISLRDRISRIMADEKFAILSTQGKAQPYASIIGYAASHDLKKIYFATPVTTRKYSLLKRCQKVAVQIDNRSKFRRKLMLIESITAIGQAVELERNSQLKMPLQSLLDRYPYFKSFYASPTCAIFKVRVLRYVHVTRFQEVSQWIP